MNIIKFILAALGLVFGALILLWVLGFVWSIVWYLAVFSIIGAIGYGGWRMFRKLEDKALGTSARNDLGTGVDINMSWDEYERKYLNK